MEREGPKNFSIEPYVAASGIMGNEIVVDEAAATSIMKRTALRRDFAVHRGYFREGREFEGDEVLAMSTARIHNQRNIAEVSQSGFSTLVRQGDQWVMFLHDQELWDRINEWGCKHYKPNREKSQAELEKEQFAKRMRREVVSGLNGAFWDEKKDIAFGSTLESVKRISLIGGAVWCLYKLGTSLAIIAPFMELWSWGFTREESIAFAKFLRENGYGLSGLFIGASISIASGNLSDRIVDKSTLSIGGDCVPNPQIPSLVLGSASLLLNSSKLIKLKRV